MTEMSLAGGVIYFYVSHIDESNLTLEELEEVDCMDLVALSLG